MSFLLRDLIFLVIWVPLLSSLSVNINFNSNHTFSTKILKAKTTTLNYVEFVFILFANGSISKLDSGLNFYENIRLLDGAKIADFSICNNNYYPLNTPSLIVITNTLSQFRIVSLENTASQVSNIQFPSYYLGIIDVYGEGSFFDTITTTNSTSYTLAKFRGVVHYRNIMHHFQLQSGVITTLRREAFVSTTSNSSTVIKLLYAVPVTYLSNEYIISVTSNPQITLYNIKTKNFDFRRYVINSSAIVGLLVDMQSIAILKYSDGTTYNINTMTNNTVIKDSFMQVDVNFSEFTVVRPQTDDNSERMFISKNKTILMRFTDDIYYYVYTPQTYSLAGTPGFIYFQSTQKGFMYSLNDFNIYSYCESTIFQCLGNEGLPCGLRLPWCEMCDTNLTTCRMCTTNYHLINNSCHELKDNCYVTNCFSCLALDESCVECISNYTLDTANNVCVYQPNSNSGSGINSQISEPSRPNQNTTNPSKENQTSEFSEFTKPSIEKRQESYSPLLKNIIEISTKLNSSPFFQNLFRFFSPLFAIFDDYWYYVYHHNTWKSFSFFPDLLVCIFLANRQRIVPDYFRFNEEWTVHAFTHSDYYANYTNSRILQIDQSMTYIEQNFQDIILRQFPLIIAGFLTIKICAFSVRLCIQAQKRNQKTIIKKQTSLSVISISVISQKESQPEQKQHNYLRRLFQYLDDFISFRNILLTFIGSNLIYVSFQLSLQFKLLFWFRFIDMVNMILAIIFGVIFIIAFFMLLPLTETLFPILKITDKDSEELKIIKRKQKRRLKKCDLNYLFLNGLKSVLFGFINGFFIEHNQLQYVLMILVKFFLLIFVFKNTWLFEKTSTLVVNCIYFFVGICADAMFLFEKLDWMPNKMLSPLIGSFSGLNCIQLSLIVVLFGSIVVGIMFQFYWSTRRIFCPQYAKINPQIYLKSTHRIFSFIPHKVTPSFQGTTEKLSQNLSEKVSEKSSESNIQSQNQACSRIRRTGGIAKKTENVCALKKETILNGTVHKKTETQGERKVKFTIIGQKKQLTTPLNEKTDKSTNVHTTIQMSSEQSRKKLKIRRGMTAVEQMEDNVFNYGKENTIGSVFDSDYRVRSKIIKNTKLTQTIKQINSPRNRGKYRKNSLTNNTKNFQLKTLRVDSEQNKQKKQQQEIQETLKRRLQTPKKSSLYSTPTKVKVESPFKSQFGTPVKRKVRKNSKKWLEGRLKTEILGQNKEKMRQR